MKQYLGLAISVVLIACVGDAATTSLPEGSPDGGGPSGTNGDGGPTGTDEGGSACVPRCADASTLTCGVTTTACPLGCAAVDTPHCAAVHPSGIVPPSALNVAGTKDVALVTTEIFHTDTGEISDIRAPNQSPAALEVVSGIGFQLVKDAAGHVVAMWSFASLTVPAKITARFTSSNPAAFVATTTVEVVGLVDTRGYDPAGKVCGHADLTIASAGGPGGGAGGIGASVAMGPGAGKPGTLAGGYGSGPAGGTYGGVGGAGGLFDGTTPGGTAGAPYGDIRISALIGGSGGGGNVASGGGGGGAIQIVAGTKIVIGGGAGPGGINAGGCGGAGGVLGNPGGGGGSGGSILLEAPVVDLQPNGVVAANGGGGGMGAGGGGSGEAGDLGSAGGAAGPGTGANYGRPGVGGGGTRSGGGVGAAAIAASGAGGAGGGGVGRIRINNRDGVFTLLPSAVLSPSKDITTLPPTTIGALDVR